VFFAGGQIGRNVPARYLRYRRPANVSVQPISGGFAGQSRPLIRWCVCRDLSQLSCTPQLRVVRKLTQAEVLAYVIVE
jgi:hypothetical protein